VEELMPKAFQMLTKLKNLDLSRNPLEELIPDVFKDIIVSNWKSVLELFSSKQKKNFQFTFIFKSKFIHFPFGTRNYNNNNNNNDDDDGKKDLKVLKCRGCRLQNINPQLYNLLNQLTELDLGNNQVIYLAIFIGFGNCFLCVCVRA